MKKIELKNFGNRLISRLLAEQVFEEAKKYNFNVEFDCSGIEFISSSFSDELFAKGYIEYGKVFKISNLDKNGLVINIIKQSFITRKCFVK